MNDRSVNFFIMTAISFVCFVVPASAQRKPSEHWSLRPRTRPNVPASDHKWIRNPIDAFVWEKLTKVGLKPAAEADRATLIRRLRPTFVSFSHTKASMGLRI